MIKKTDKQVKRKAPAWSYRENTDNTTELVRTETWWLFWVTPLYSRDTILAHQGFPE